MSQNFQMMVGLFGGTIGAWQALCHLPHGWNIVAPLVIVAVALRLYIKPFHFRSPSR